MRIIAAAPPRVARYLAVLAFTGTRLTAMTRLKPSDVDLERGFLRLFVAKVKRTIEVPIHRGLRVHLEAALAEARGAPYLFTSRPRASPAERPPLDNSTVRNRLRAIVRSLGLASGREEHGWTPHGFRHAFETHCVDAGKPQFVIDAWLGHSTGRSTAAGYYKHTPEKSKDHMDTLNFPGVPASPAPVTPTAAA